MRTLQEIFDVVIDNGYYCYSNEIGSKFGSNYMCESLEKAYEFGVIDTLEKETALYSIRHFLRISGDCVYLISAVLDSLNLDYTCDKNWLFAGNKCLEIYRNWDNRHKIIAGCVV